jgi:1,4-dihydroxy-2-naphthoyl-CoA synthase
MAAWQHVHAYPTVNLLRAGTAAAIELNRPDSLNAWNEQLGVDLRAAVERVASDDDVRAVLLRGAGRAFSIPARNSDQRSTASSPSGTTRSSLACAGCLNPSWPPSTAQQ